VVFTLSLAPPAVESGTGMPSFAAGDVLATATFSLLDLLTDGKDATGIDMPLAAAEGYPAGGGVAAGATVADLHVSITGWQALKSASKRN
jgi:hypothetical protein